jgi:hypothetical protein
MDLGIPPMDLDQIKFEARRQLAKEHFDEAVRAEVTRLKTHKPWWYIFFPFEITIRKRK